MSKIIGFTCSAFDLCHAGHLAMLYEAKQQCDHLIVGLHVDPNLEREHKNRPIESVVERYIRLKSCKYVDEIIPYTTESDLLEILTVYPINIRILGEEYMDTNFTGREICEKYGIKLYFNSRNHPFSSSGLRKRIIESGK